VLEKLKKAYLLWHEYHGTLAKTHRYSLGQRIDDFFVQAIEAIVAASFLSKQEKIPYVRIAIRKIDMIKVLLMIVWESKSMDTKKYATLSVEIDVVGKMLGGWNGQLQKQNSPESANRRTGEK